MSRSTRKSAAQWAELVNQFASGQESEREFCLTHDIQLATLRKWRYHFKAKNNSAAVPARFIKASLPASNLSLGSAVLCLGGDVRLECPASLDVPGLAQLVLAVHHGR